MGTSMKTLMMEAPDGQLDESARKMISNWSEPPKALEILEVLDACVCGSLASGFVMSALSVMLETTLKQEGITREELLPLAHWRIEQTVEQS